MTARTAGELRANNSRKLVELSIKGMLPKNSLGRRQFTKLHVYGGAEHPHAAQQAAVVDIQSLILRRKKHWLKHNTAHWTP